MFILPGSYIIISYFVNVCHSTDTLLQYSQSLTLISPVYNLSPLMFHAMIAFRILQKHGGAASVHYQAVKCSAMIITQNLPRRNEFYNVSTNLF